MAYNNAITAANDLLSQSQDDILQNFQAIQTLIEVNHETFGAADEGKHKFVTFPIQVADPATALDEVALYSKDNAAGDPALFFKPENQGVGATEYDFTTSTAHPSVTGECGFPCGIVMKWGIGVATGGGAGALNTFINPFTDGVGGNAAPYSVVITEISPAANTHNFVQVVNGSVLATGASFRATSFDGNGNNSTVPIYYVAFGR